MSRARKISQLPLITSVGEESFLPIVVNGVTYRIRPVTIANSGTSGGSGTAGTSGTSGTSAFLINLDGGTAFSAPIDLNIDGGAAE